MAIQNVQSFVAGHWVDPNDAARTIQSAVSGETIARAGNDALDVAGMLDHARHVGGPALRKLGFHDRARMLKALATHLSAHKQVLYDVSFSTGATQADHLIDIDGGIGTLFVFASKGRRELPDGPVFIDGSIEQLSKSGSFLGQHICTPLKGTAIHINAFNFPVWGMLEKLAPTLLAGMPAIVKPATTTGYVAERAVRIILDSGILPEGALQLVSGSMGAMLDHLTHQDVVSFTGSAQTALHLRSIPVIQQNSVRFVAEQDSLNASILGPDATPDTPEFELFVKEVHREMTTKAGQKCTAIRRIIAPEDLITSVLDAVSVRLGRTIVGDPRDKDVQMGALVSAAQKEDVLNKVADIASEAEHVLGDPDQMTLRGADPSKGAFVPPMLLYCADPDAATSVHEIEAFGPVATLMPYKDLDHAVELANRGGGSLVASVITRDGEVARSVVAEAASHHGRLYFNNRDSMAESTGHGSPLPHMVHGGPGRAGGGEEMGGIRGVMHYMQRTAIQGSPDVLSAISDNWVPGAKKEEASIHPFRQTFDALKIGETLHTDSRKITLEDVDHFAHFTGDTFYAHMDEEAARRNPFFPGRVAHGYLLLSFAAGLFVDPDEGPVLANTGLDGLRFMKPVVPGDSIRVALSVKHKTRRTADYGEVRWHVSIINQNDEPVAEYALLTMNAY
ncbi:MAG: phenylacetic acid degradation bifunctional protein PaaZ [Pseudomonadota bacterium]